MKEWDCCRTCLNNKSLNVIFKCKNEYQKYSDILMLITGLQIKINDSLPQLICTNCTNFVNQVLVFRQKCQSSYEYLKKILCRERNKLDCSIQSEKNKINAKNNEDEINIHNINYQFSSEDNQNDPTNLFLNTHKESKEIKEFKSDNVLKEDNCIEFVGLIKDLLKKHSPIIFENTKPLKKVEVDFDEIKSKIKNVEIDCIDNINKVQEKVQMIESVERLECEYCGKLFKSKLCLYKHMLLHTGRNIICEHCGEKYISKRRLLLHCRAKHGYERIDKCSYCDHKASSPALLKIHERIHTGEKPFVCEQCGASFHRRSTYLQHLPIHLAEKTVKCDECSSLFKSVTRMKIHKYNDHTSRKYRYICGICNRIFRQRGSCLKHCRRVHSGHVRITTMLREECLQSDKQRNYPEVVYNEYGETWKT